MLKIQILGTGCPKCKKLTENAETALKELSLEVVVEKVTDLRAIVAYGVMMTPALVVDGQVKLSGRVASVQEIINLLK